MPSNPTNKAIADFNAKYAVGSTVRVQRDGGAVTEHVLNQPAELLGGHTPVVWLDGISGCFAMNRVLGPSQEANNVE